MTAEAKIKLSVDGASAAVTNISSVTASLGGLSDKAKDFQGLWKGLAGSLTVGALTMQVKSIIDAADSMNDLSQQVGIGVQQLGKYQLATAQSGTTMEAMAKGVKALSVNMAEHSDELKKAGITATTADGALLQLADVFAAMPDGIEKTALANKLFGKSGMELIPMLNLGSAGLQESAEKSAKYAATLELLAPQADRFNDQMAELGLHTKVGSMAIVNDAMPAMISITAAMAAAAQEGGLLMAMWVGLGGAMHEFVAKPFQVLFLGINNTIDEANARLMLFFRQTAEADKLYAVVAQRNKQILALTTENPAPAPAAVKTFDTKKWTDEYKALMAAIGGAKGTAKEAASEFDRLAKSGAELATSLIDISGGLSGDFAKKWESLTAAYQSGAISLDRLVLAQKKLLEQQPAMVAEFKAATKAAEDRQAAYLKEAAGIEAFMLAQQEAANASIKSVSDRIASLRAEEEAVAISQAQNISLAAAVELVAIARLKEEQARKFVPGYEGWEAIQREIDKRQELLGLMNTKDLREREQSGWLSFYQSLDKTAQETFTNVLEGGQGIWTKLRNTAKAVFFDWLYQMTAKKWLINLTVSASGGALPASAGAGGLSDIGGLKNMASMAGVGGSFSAGVGAGFSSLLGEAGIMGGLDAGAIAIGAGNIAAGLGTLAGVLGPIALGIGGVYALAKRLDHSGTPHSGAGTAYSAASGLAQASAGASGAGLFSKGIAYDSSTEQMTTGLVKSIVQILDSTATAFGKEAGYQAAASFAADGRDGSYGALYISQLNQTISDFAVWKGHGQTFSAGAAGSAEYLAKVSADVRTALEGIGLPSWATSMLDKLGDAPTLQQLADTVQQITATQTALERMGKTLAGFSAMGETAVGKLIDASGGINNLAANASTYYDNFYTEGEKQAATLKTVADAFAAVSVPMPATREAFRTLVESLEATADTNPYASAALATVLSMSGAFASVVPAAAAAEEATATLVDTVEEIATLGQELDALRNPVRGIKDVAQGIFNLEKEGQRLQVELWRTYGDSNSLLAANKLQRDIETAGMTAEEVALYDLNASRRAEIDTIVQQRQAHADAVASWQTYFDLFATPQEKQTRARAIVQAVLPADVDTLQEYKDYVWGLTVQFGLGSAEMKAATDVAQQFAVAFPEVAQEVAEVSAASTVLTKDLSAFRAGFFTTAEQTALATQDMTASLQALGLTTLPTSNAEFRALALGIDTSTESGRLLFNGLMGLAGGFAQLHPLVTTATEVVETLDSAIASLRASGASRTVQQIAGNMLTLEEQIFQLQNAGNTAALRGHILDGLSDVKDSVTGLSEKDLQQLIWSFEDAGDAAQATADALKTAADAEKQAAADAAAAAKRVADEHDALWKRYLVAIGDTAALQKLELDGVDQANQELLQKVLNAEAAKEAADKASAAAEQMKSAWSSLTETITAEVRRIRGLIDESSGASYASLQAQFALATAQTRAGDQDAAKLLPGLSQSMLTAFEATATSLADLQRERALTANSLEQTAALIAGGTATTTPVTDATGGRGRGTSLATNSSASTYAVAPTTPAYGLSDMVVELRAEIAALKDEVKGLRGEAKATSETIAINTGKTARLNQKWDDVGLPITTETDLAAVYGA